MTLGGAGRRKSGPNVQPARIVVAEHVTNQPAFFNTRTAPDSFAAALITRNHLKNAIRCRQQKIFPARPGRPATPEFGNYWVPNLLSIAHTLCCLNRKTPVNKNMFPRSAAQESPSLCGVPLRRGRPCQIDEQERRRLLIEAAESVFLESGYSAAVTSDIARRACMSKKTLYRLFDSKEALFAAVVASRRESIAMEPLGNIHCAD